jgi:hypothetical protein
LIKCSYPDLGIRKRAAEKIMDAEKMGCVLGFYKNQGLPVAGLKTAENSSPTVRCVINFS